MMLWLLGQFLYSTVKVQETNWHVYGNAWQQEWKASSLTIFGGHSLFNPTICQPCRAHLETENNFPQNRPPSWSGLYKPLNDHKNWSFKLIPTEVSACEKAQRWQQGLVLLAEACMRVLEWRWNIRTNTHVEWLKLVTTIVNASSTFAMSISAGCFPSTVWHVGF